MNRTSNFRLISTILILASLLTVYSCKKDEESPSDPNYPTILERLNSVEYQNQVNAYWERNPFVQSDLSLFGFCAKTVKYRELDAPGTYKEITPSEAKTIARNFINLNPKETGISDTTGIGLTVTRQFASGNYYVTYLETHEQKADTLRILNTALSLRIENEQVVECINNWFPTVYVPSAFIIAPEKAINDLVGKKYLLPTPDGGITGTVTESDLAGATYKTMIVQYPEKASTSTSQKVELRIVYRIYLPLTLNYFYVDVMYNVLLDTESTIIS